jgi:hypothetical protein
MQLPGCKMSVTGILNPQDTRTVVQESNAKTGSCFSKKAKSDCWTEIGAFLEVLQAYNDFELGAYSVVLFLMGTPRWLTQEKRKRGKREHVEDSKF